MDTDDLPNEFDVVVLGTGLTETIASAAFSRIGLKVLHLDRNDYYGGSFANFNLQGVEEWKKKNEGLKSEQGKEQPVTAEIQRVAGEGNTVTSLPCEPPQAHNIKTEFHVRERTEEEKAVAEASRTRTASQSLVPNLSEFTITSDEKCEAAKTPSADKDISIAENSVSSSENESDPSPEASTECSAQDKPETAATEDGNADTDAKEAVEESPAISAPSKKPKEWTREGLNEDWRKFCFDLSPKLLYCSGDLVELLIQSDVARYCEFRTVSRVLTVLNDTLLQVPCSRADVFSSKIVSLIEKRMMMKFLQFAVEYENHPDEYKEYKDHTFVEFLKSKKLSTNVQHFVQHAIAMVNDAESTEKGLKNTQVFLRSLGRYGNTAFLFSLYGSGELPQAFSRLSAVFGGVYCLKMSASHLIADDKNKCCGIIATNGKKINCKYVIAEASYLPPSFVQYPAGRKTSRAIYITDKSICESKDSELSLLNYMSKDLTTQSVTVMELPPSACVCPKGLFVVHLIQERGTDDPEKDFDEVKKRLFAETPEDSKPQILWSAYFSQGDLSQVSLSPSAMENIFVTSGGGDGSLDMENSVSEAKQIFLKVCPEEEFLPKPPNPEDIMYVDDEEAAVVSGPGEFESSAKQEMDKEEEKTDQDTEKL